MPNVKYYSQGAYPRAYFQKNSLFSLVLQQPESVLPNAPVYSHRLDVRPYGAHSVTPVGQSVKAHYQNFFLPGCGANGITQVNGYDYLDYPSVYDLIDMVFYSGSAGQKMAFYCWPGSDPNKIALQFFGQDSLKIDVAGFLKVFKNGYWVKMDEAVAYQVNSSGGIVQLGWSANYVNMNGDNVVELSFDSYDPTLPLVLQIGPTPAQPQSPTDGICWGSYYGGSSDDEVFDTETDADGNHYLTGYTESDFLTFQSNVGTQIVNSVPSVILTKFSAQKELNWTVYYGGNGDQSAFAMAVKGQPAEIYIGGYTTASDLFTQSQAGAYNDLSGAGTLNSRGFIGRFNDIGQLQWSTYFGNGNEEILGMDFDTQGRLHIVGECDGSYPNQTLSGATSWSPGSSINVLIARFSSTDALEWCTAYGGTGIDQGTDVVCHNNGFYVNGYTISTDIPTVDGGSYAYDQTTNAGGIDNVILSFSSAAACNWATYFGGNGWDQPGHNSMACMANGDLFLCGRSQSTNLPTLAGGGYYNAAGSANGAGYIARFKGVLHERTWCTYFGGPANTGIESLELAGEQLFAVGYTSEQIIPIFNFPGLYHQPNLIGAANGIGANNGKDGLLLAFNAASTALRYCSYFGGEQGGLGESIRSASFHQGELFIAGITSKNFPIDQTFPIYDPGDPAYYDGVYELTVTNWQDMFVGTLCVEALTGPVGIENPVSPNTTLAADLVGPGLWKVVGIPRGRHTLSVFDAVGKVVRSEQVIVPTSGSTLVDLTGCADGVYTIVTNQPASGAVRVVLNR